MTEIFTGQFSHGGETLTIKVSNDSGGSTPPDPPPPDPTPAPDEILSNPAEPGGYGAMGGFTYIARFFKITNSRKVKGIEIFSAAAGNVTATIWKRLSAGSYECAWTDTFAHPGGGWYRKTLAFDVPASGDYYPGANHGALGCGFVTTGPTSYAAGNVGTVGATNSFTEVGSIATPGIKIVLEGVGGGTSPAPTAMLCILVDGQSNAEKQGGPNPYTRRHADKVDLRDYGQGPYVSWLGELGDLLIDTGKFAQVTIIGRAVGGSNVESWAAGGSNHANVAANCNEALSLGYTKAINISMIGEANATVGNITPEAYAAAVNSRIAAYKASGLQMEFFVPLETWTPNGQPNEANVRAGQKLVVNNVDVFAGPDFDQLVSNQHRWINAHFNNAGLSAVAYLWAILVAARAA